VPAAVIILVGISAVAILVAIRALILATSWRSRKPSKLPTAVALLLWAGASVALAGVWFIVAVAAHKVDESLTNSWIIANATYPIVGVGIVLMHRRLLR
jgi:hypothetical protein